MAEKLNLVPIKHADPLDAYLSGKPLTEATAALRHPKNTSPNPQEDILKYLQDHMPEDDLIRPLTKEERKKLQKLHGHEGWPVLQRLIKRALQIHENTAITVSQNRPLGNRDRIAEEWFFVNTYKRFMLELDSQVKAEMKILEAENKKK